jgi:hypothetical protein
MTFWQKHSHCRSRPDQDTDMTRTHSGRSIHTVGQVSVRTRTHSSRSIHTVDQVSVRARTGQGHILAEAFTL